MLPARELLLAQLDQAWVELQGWTRGLTQAEYLWEPAPGCWKLFRRPDGRWKYDYAIPDPVPAPPTTIGWKVVHLASCKEIYFEYAYGPARKTWLEVFATPTWAAGRRWLQDGQAKLRSALESETDLGRQVQTNWGEAWPAWRVFWAMAHHDLTHCAEIGVLRDLYRATRASSGPGRARPRARPAAPRS